MAFKGYREKFVDEGAATKYDEVVYRSGSVSKLLWDVESSILDGIVAEARRRNGRLDYLDFACGTGRILSFLERKVDRSTGIDVSRAMLDRAAEKARGARLLCRDITARGAEVEGRYDLITCFRFLKNAEPDLRRAAVRQLAKRLKGPGSLLVVNSHGGNPFSYRAFLVPYHWLKAVARGRKLEGYLSNAEVRAVVDQAGLVVERVYGYGFVSGKVLKLLPYSVALWIERRLAGLKGAQPFGVNQLFVCRLRPGAPRSGAEDGGRRVASGRRKA